MRIRSKERSGKSETGSKAGNTRKSDARGAISGGKLPSSSTICSVKASPGFAGTVSGEGKRLCWKILIFIDVIPGLKML
jgi:hypothetical protein